MRFQYVFYIGDQKPIVIGSVVSSTGAAITSATCTLVDHVGGALVGALQIARIELGEFQVLCASCNWIKRYEDLECFKDTWTVQA